MCGGTWEYRTRSACQRRWRAGTVAPIRVRARGWSHARQAGLEVRDRVGFAAANPAAAVKAMWDRGHGKSTYREMGERLGIKEGRDTSSSYGGYALKRRPAA